MSLLALDSAAAIGLISRNDIAILPAGASAPAA